MAPHTKAFFKKVINTKVFAMNKIKKSAVAHNGDTLFTIKPAYQSKLTARQHSKKKLGRLFFHDSSVFPSLSPLVEAASLRFRKVP